MNKFLKNLNFENIIESEEKDLQFIALKKLYLNISEKKFYLTLIILNSLICYQLSWKWENYWKEFWEESEKYKFKNFDDIFIFFKIFLENCKNNRRFTKVKLKRLEKWRLFLENIFFWKEDFFYKNMEKLWKDLAKNFKQKITAKTIVFAIKMFWYWARNIFPFQKYPANFMIPIDSRLEKLFLKFWKKDEKIEDFFIKISKKTKIPLLHLDAFLWINTDNILADKEF